MGMIADIAVKIEMEKFQKQIEQWENDVLPTEQILAYIKTHIQKVIDDCDSGYR